MPDPEQLSFMAPHNIDGEPDEVAREASETLRALLGTVDNYAAGVERQVRNYVVGPGIIAGELSDPDTVEEAWEAAPAAAQLARIRGFLQRAEDLAGDLVSGVK